MSIQVVFVYNKANTFGIQRDVELLESMLLEYNRSVRITFAKVRHADLLEQPVACDICIHLEIPCAVWMPFALKNILMVNSEWWVSQWNTLLPKFDHVFTKIEGIQSVLPGSIYIPWTVQTMSSSLPQQNASLKCLWLLGGSKNKREFAQTLIPLWKESYPPLTVYTTSPLFEVAPTLPNVTIHVKDLTDSAERWAIQQSYPVHICASKSEGFGMAAAEGEAAGAFLILNNIDSYVTNFKGEHTAFLETPLRNDSTYSIARFADLSGASPALAEQLDTILEKITKKTNFEEVREEQERSHKERTERFKQAMRGFLKGVSEELLSSKQKGNRHLPPVLDNSSDSCPPISIITLTYNRRKFIDLAFHNIILTDYPKDKIEWVVVDDSNVPEEQISDKIAAFAKRAPVAKIVYVPLPKKHSVGFKRNLGIERASNDIILFMDDDDHYPETSVRRRVAWLTKFKFHNPNLDTIKAVGCATIACYDLVKGLSAVNTPPWELSQAERVSEATLTFYKSFWQEQKFPHVNSSEGEGFLKGREGNFMEIPPQQIIVAFSHQGNSSGRRIPVPDNMKPGCFWGFPKEYLIWIHKLAGIEVEEEQEIQNKVVQNRP